jgi:L-iditol 2-dehydrogenase
MKALVKIAKGPGNIGVREVDRPLLPAENWVIIQVKAAGVCGTDLHIWHDEFTYWPPVVLGHEFAGVVDSVGLAVKNFKPGDRVVAEPHAKACGQCYLCRTGRVQLCREKRSPGWGIDGAMTSYVQCPKPSYIEFPMASRFIWRP